MKLNPVISRPARSGFALVMTMILSAIALAILASVLAWSASSARLTHRSIEYTRSVAAAEGATDKVISQITQDFLSGGERLVSNNLNSYRQNTVPTGADSSYWNSWVFNDANGNLGQTFVQRTPGSSYVVLGSTYAGLSGYVSTYTIASHASDSASAQGVMGGVLQQIQLTGIPIFQFMMFSYSNMEVSCGEPFDITGRVHANGTLYVEPDSSMTFESGVTAVTSILFQRDPLDPRGSPAGSVVYVNPDEKIAPSTALTLPIGIAYTPEGIRGIIEPPPAGGDTDPAVANIRYYNESEMLITVADNGVTIQSGGINLSSNDVSVFVSTSNSFFDAREGKMVESIDLDITNLDTWIVTNNSLVHTLIGSNLTSIYVLDNRNLPANQLGAVRVKNGTQLPPNGLTVATARPLYVQGDYNELNPAFLGTNNTSATRPASLVADAITVLSDNWQDINSRSDVSFRNATATTVNAAFLTGVVETTSANYSGGMENFPRFLETWGSAVFTYNGSMIKMFPSLFATGPWGEGNVYVPPTRNWAYDINFDDPTKLPPLTPSLLKVVRGQWVTVPPGQNVASAVP